IATVSEERNIAIPINSYYLTTLGQFNVSDFTHILRVNVTEDVLENTSIKFLVSFDARQTWRYWNGTKWLESSLNNIELNGMNENTIESLTQDIWESDYGFNKGRTQNIDFAISLRTTNASYSPSLSKITINYKKEGYDEVSPFIQNKQGQPYSELLEFNELAGLNNKGNNTYQISNDGEKFYYFNGANWALAQNGVEESNAADVINLNIAQFVTDVGTGEFYFKLFLNAPVHNEPAIIDDISLSYIYHVDPIIESISASSGSNDSISNVTIYGSNFVNGLRVKLIKEGAQDILAKNINFISNSEINLDFDLSLASLGTYSVKLINPDQRSFTLENVFTINDASPIITQITPLQGTNDNILNIQIIGSNFDQDLKVRLLKSGEKNIDCEILEVTDTNISCNFDLTGKAKGSWNIEIINPSSLATKLDNAFTVNPSVYKLSFITSEKELRLNKASSKIIIEAHDYAGNFVNVTADTNILISSTSLTSKFSINKINWSNSLVGLIPSGNSSITFYYKDNSEGSYTLSAQEDPDLGWLDVVQNIVINNNASSKWHFDVLDEYTFDNTQIEILNSKVALKNIEQEKQDITLNFDSLNDYIEEDIKGEVTYWYQDEENYGHFNAEAINKLVVGTKLFINGNLYSIIEINDGGTPYKSVKLGASASSGTIDKIIGTKFTGGKISLNGGILGTQESPGLSCLDILKNDSDSPSGIYWINPTQVEEEIFQVYCDMTTDGGGWTLALLNSQYGTPVVPNWNDVVNKNNITGSMENGLNSGFDSFLGVKYWNLLGNKLRIEQGGSSTSLSRRAYYDFYLDNNNYYALKLSNENVTLGGESSGFYTSHNNKPLTTYDADHDTNSGNCASYYGNTAWWYTSCWGGSFWGGGTGGSYQNKPYWSGSSSNYYNWGAIWIKDVSVNPNFSLGTLFPISSYTTQTKSQINTQNWDHIKNIEIDEETPLSTSIKYLMSFDKKQTWRYFDGTSWKISNLNNVEIDGMTKTDIEAFTQENLESAGGFIKGYTQSIDFAISLKTTDLNNTPSLNQISINYYIPAYNTYNQ
ncbi:MAG: fibrinogen-like YCDxxxxGGGW domain-containing protein, partial [Tissierellia bacterium]|nr:fibrinogen-like YCDxxxxGGGW domain-containing protein [Tissierellia bacterium]